MLAKKRSAQNTISSVLLLRSEGASWQDGRTARSGALYVLRPFCPRVRGAASYLITFLYGGTSFPRLHRRRRKRLRPRRPRKECERDARSTLFAGKRHWGRVKKAPQVRRNQWRTRSRQRHEANIGREINAKPFRQKWTFNRADLSLDVCAVTSCRGRHDCGPYVKYGQLDTESVSAVL